jgi:DNA-directed RNA polymerase subunit RPC12/RpoP
VSDIRKTDGDTDQGVLTDDRRQVDRRATDPPASDLGINCQHCGRRLGLDVHALAVPVSQRMQCPRCKGWMMIVIRLLEERITRLDVTVKAEA